METGFLSRALFCPVSLQTTRERKEKGGERGEKKKGLLALIIFILPTLEIVSERQKSARDTPLGHLSRAVPFSKIRVYTGMKWAKMAKKCWKGRSWAAEFGHFSPSGNICLQYLPGFLKRWFLKICPFSPQRHGNWVFGLPWAYKPHGREKRREGREGRRKKDCWHS